MAQKRVRWWSYKDDLESPQEITGVNSFIQNFVWKLDVAVVHSPEVILGQQCWRVSVFSLKPLFSLWDASGTGYPPARFNNWPLLELSRLQLGAGVLNFPLVPLMLAMVLNSSAVEPGQQVYVD
ncbi:hypothetical protein ANANG_G00254150 [Anguilla anguilla]|uniref:Uncharacterized protein n=1 Tax=Anguilla anguilla TaxID=7936 RepID=A0A9D3LU92_ANGAN|nr:hypothetical protein ANANG_G00254150 [Anguilla anguilla]